MRRFLLIVILLVALAPCGKAQQALDTYGGVLATRCPADNVEWSVQTIGVYQVICTPTNGNASGHSHVFNYRGVQYIASDCSHTNTAHGLTLTNCQYRDAKYGVGFNVDDLYYARIKGWGFNAGGPGAFRTAVNSQISTPNKVPFMEFGSGGTQGFQNGFQHCINGADGVRQCKNLWNLGTAAYNGSQSRNVVDVYDPAFQAYENNEYANDAALATFKTSPYFIGAIHWDSDNLSGFNGANGTTSGVPAAQAACPDIFPCHPWETDPCCGGWHSPMQSGVGNIATAAPHQVNNPRNATAPNACFADQTNYTKAAFAAFLKGRYGNVGALDLAWGSNYAIGGVNNSDGFGTDGLRSTLSLGNSGTAYNFGLLGNVDPYSIEVDVAGACVGGDSQGGGVLRGATINSATSTLNYATGSGILNFTVAPVGTVSISYWHGGWGNGHGVLDESGANIGNADTTGAPGASAAQIKTQVIDLENFLTQYTNKFLTVIKTAYNLVFTNAGLPPKLFIAGGPFGTNRDLPRCGILTGAGQVADIISVTMGTTQAEMNYLTTCSGDKAFILTQWSSSERDSEWYDCPAADCSNQPSPWPPLLIDFSTQTTRGAGYQADQTANWGNANQANGKHSWVGNMFWALHGESYPLFWALSLISWRDNAWDGNENVTGSVVCSPPTQAFFCGGESVNEAAHGNFLGPVTTANRQIDNNLAGLSSSPVAISGSGTITGSGVVKNP